MEWRSSADAEALAARAALLAEMRRFFGDRGVMEVITPVLSGAGNTDPGIEPFALAAGQARWLRTSPEYAMKRLLAGGSGDIYELGAVFRSGEAGRRHNPEFTMLEWYRVGWSYRDLMREVADLVRDCGARFGHRWRVVESSYGDLFRRHAAIDALAAPETVLRSRAAELGIEAGNGRDWSRDDWLDLLLTHIVQPALPGDTLTLVHDFPASQAALARIRPGEPPVAERFEVFLGGSELANGYQELTDAREQRARFERENRRRGAMGRRPAPLDERLLAALEAGLPACAGVALGVDRLLAACLGADSLEQVIPFPWERA